MVTFQTGYPPFPVGALPVLKEGGAGVNRKYPIFWKLVAPDYDVELLDGLQKDVFTSWTDDNWLWTPRQIVSWFGCSKRKARRVFRQMEKKGIIMDYWKWLKEQHDKIDCLAENK